MDPKKRFFEAGLRSWCCKRTYFLGPLALVTPSQPTNPGYALRLAATGYACFRAGACGLQTACSGGNSTPAVPGPAWASAIVPATASVDLRSAAPFAILAGSTVTNTGATKVVGDVGISPGTAITGIPVPGRVRVYRDNGS